jgi:ribosomal protein S18 acetylase RimI-like enzyme
MFKIVQATSNDIALIRELTFKVWPQTYSASLSPKQIDYMLEMMYSESSLKNQMQNGSQFIIVYDESEPVGFAAYFLKESGIYKLDKIYILPSQQGKGTGKFVVDYIINAIREKGATALQLQVKRDNKARFFYEKLGFVVLYEADFDIGNGFFMNDYVMELKLAPVS